MTIGGMMGAISSGKIADLLGRRTVLSFIKTLLFCIQLTNNNSCQVYLTSSSVKKHRQCGSLTYFVQLAG